MTDTPPPPGIEIRALDTVEKVHTASQVLADVWGGDRGGMPPNLLRALAHAGNYAVGLYDGDRMVGASVAFFAAPPFLGAVFLAAFLAVFFFGALFFAAFFFAAFFLAAVFLAAFFAMMRSPE